MKLTKGLRMATEKNDQAGIVDMNGPEGESLFSHPTAWIFTKERIPEIQKRLDELWVHYRDVKDDRLLALISGLCIESSVDLLLEAIAPDFTKYREDLDFSFSVKIKMARSLKLLPARFLTYCDLARQIRNEFAHHLEYRTFDNLDARHLAKIVPYVNSFLRRNTESPDYPTLYRELVGLTLTALQIYTIHVFHLRKFLEHGASQESFKLWMEARQQVSE
jgi:hypothetical protein